MSLYNIPIYILAGGNGFDTAAALRLAAENARQGHIYAIDLLQESHGLSNGELDLVREAERRYGGTAPFGPGWATARADMLERAADGLEAAVRAEYEAEQKSKNGSRPNA